MTQANATPIVVFSKLSGFGLLLLGFAALIAAGSLFINSGAPANAPEIIKHDFRLVQLGEFRQDQFLVDGGTGRVWQSVCAGEVVGPDCKGMLIWKEMYVGGVTPRDVSVTQDYLQHKYLQAGNGGK